MRGARCRNLVPRFRIVGDVLSLCVESAELSVGSALLGREKIGLWRLGLDEGVDQRTIDRIVEVLPNAYRYSVE